MYLQPKILTCFFILLTLVCLTKQAHAQCDPRRDSLALVALFDATNGANWTVKTNWKVVGQPISAWYGIRTDASGCVITIDLDGDITSINGSRNGNGLSGTLPLTINSLSNLQEFSLSNNQISGTIPLITITSLRYIYLHSNKFTGDIPNFASPNLDVLSLSANSLQNNIPDFSFIPKLRLLYLDGNRLIGVIPNFNLPNLELLSISNNQLVGNIPNFSLPNLRYLELYSNQLTGIIPNFNSPKLEVLQLYQNQLDSCPKFTNLPSLKKDTTFQRGLRNYRNRLTFDDILPNMNFNTTATFIYSPQDSIFKDTTYTRTTNDPLSINLNIDDTVTTNIYKWYKNGTLFRTVNGSNKLSFASLAVADAGVYTCQVTNPNAPLLILYSRKATVKVLSCRINDSIELVRLYNATNGANWTNKWDLTKPINTWFGVSLDANGCVAQIEMSSNNLIGTLPNLSMPNLKLLALNSNQLSGNVPNFDLALLEVLNLADNKFTGNIPNFNLPNLVILQLHNTPLDGNIPLFNLPKLRILYLFGNKLSGSIPNFNFPNLTEFRLHSNQLTGSIPNFNLPNLAVLLLANNNLQGAIPTFTNTPNLEIFESSSNQLSGTIPNFDLPKLVTIGLVDNQLTGAIPNFNLPNLKNLTLSKNKLSDTIPNFNTPKLEIFSIYTNQLSGRIANLNVPNLRSFLVYANKFSFDGILSPIQQGTKTSVNFNSYSPQDSIYKDTTYQNTEGGKLTIDLGIDAAITSNIYKWYKNNVFVDSIIGSNKRVFNSIQLPDAGVWTCRVTNRNAPDLTLFSRKATISVAKCNTIKTDAIDDNITVNETNATEFTVTDNDRFDAAAQLNITLLKKPQYGTLTTLGNGKFRYESLPILRGVTQMFRYQLCNTLCPNDCDSAQVTIDIQGVSPVVKASKGITPQNNDGKNDVLAFEETDDVTRYPDSELIIYNRWNDIVFRAKPYLNNWDGNRNGQPLPAGTYYYILHLNQKEGKTLTGDVTIIR